MTMTSTPSHQSSIASLSLHEKSIDGINLEDAHKATPLRQTTTSHSFIQTQPLPSHIVITPVTTATLPSFRRTISLILPIRYPNSFYTSILTDPAASSLSRAAIWQHRSRASKRKQENDRPISQQLAVSKLSDDFLENGELVGAIRCRLESVPKPPSTDNSPAVEHMLYIQALALLSPYRGHGIATYLLDAVTTEALRMHADVSGVYAHVWEANEEGLDWYKRRGFVVEEPVIQGYYRRLKPDGARIVRRGIRVRDWLRVRGEAGTVGMTD